MDTSRSSSRDPPATAASADAALIDGHSDDGGGVWPRDCRVGRRGSDRWTHAQQHAGGASAGAASADAALIDGHPIVTDQVAGDISPRRPTRL